MKKGWELKKLGDVCYSKSSNVSQNKLADEVGDYPIFGASGLIKNVSFYHRDKPYLSIVKDGSGFGRITKMDAFTSVIGTLQYILPNDEIDLDYLNYSLMSVDFKKYVQGAAIPHIYFKDYKNEPFLWMPLPEQQRLVAIINEAFAGIAKAKANAEKNFKNSKELFESYLQGVFENKGKDWEEKILGDVCSLYQGIAINAKTKHALVEKSDLPLLRIKDLKNNTVEQYIDPNNFPVNALVNEEDIIYTRTGSLGLVFRGKRGVLHNNSFKIVPTSELTKDYLFIWLQNPIFKAKIMGLAMKAAQPDITHAIFKIQEIAIPPIKEQNKIVKNLDALSLETKKLEAIYQQKINDLEELKKSVLQTAFSGEIKIVKSSESVVTNVISLQKVEGISPTDLQAGITALAFQKHIEINKQDAFGHVKAEKIVHLTEYILNIDLERNPVKDAAGPNDFPHAKKVESRATKAGFYSVAAKKGLGESGYSYSAGRSMDTIITKTQTCLGARGTKLAQLLKMIVPMNTQQAEIVATIYAAWNNLILKGNPFSDDDIVYEARENWREEKLNIVREKFVNALDWMKKNELFIPKGNGKIVLAK